MISRRLFLLLLLPFVRIRSAEVPPVWETAAVEGDPLFFVQSEGVGLAKSMLLFTPEQPPVIRSATLEKTFEPGKDYEWKAGSREITLVKGTSILSKTATELHPEPNAPHSYRACRDGKSWMLFGEGRYFHDLQCVASYPTKEAWKGPRPQPAPAGELRHVRTKLKAGEPLKLVTLGDSISTGANASGSAAAPPMQPGYPDLVAKGLEARFGSRISAKNLSVGGKDSAWGLKQVPAVLAEKPDLVILAFGMNDASGRRSTEEFSALIRQTVEQIRTGAPECDVILVSPMTANPEWTHAAPELYPEYATALKKLTGPGCSLADVTTMWSAILERKPYLCLTGNGLNHPNDFGHRLYADVIMAVIGGR